MRKMRSGGGWRRTEGSRTVRAHMILHRLVCMGDRHLAQGVVPGKRFRCEEYLEERID